MDTSVDFRVTSVWEYNQKSACFAGVPLVRDSFKTKSVKDIYIIKTNPKILGVLEPKKGQHWRVTGKSKIRLVAHGEHKITEHHYINPASCEITLEIIDEDFINFIKKESDFKGIGDYKARELWATFGKGLFKILNEKNINELTKVLTEQSATSLINGFQKYSNLKYSAYFTENGIPPQIQQKLFKYHKENSVQSIQENPYRLITMGMTFNEVDKIALNNFELKSDDIRRLVGAVEYVIKKFCRAGGHTVAYHNDIFNSIFKLLGNNDLVSQALKVANVSKTYFIDLETGGYHLTPLLVMEKVIAKRLLSLNKKTTEINHEYDNAFFTASNELPYKLTDKQIDAVLMSLSAHVSCITGGAGTGKTTVLRTVLRAYHQLGFEIKPMALSGKARIKLQQSIGFQSLTIAAFLNEPSIDGDAKCIVVIDEASMVDLLTMYKIISHINPNVRLLLVGDYHQLPPIGVGLILADIVKSGIIKSTELDIVKRQDEKSGIPEYSRSIKNGVVPEELITGHIYFHDTQSDKINDKCVELYSPEAENTQIIAATKNIVSNINIDCQKKVNSKSERFIFESFGDLYQTDLLLNDPVLFTKNNYNIGIQNGSLGKLISIEKTDESIGVVKLDDSDEEIFITKQLLDTLDAAYCITLHKAQGSQFKRVVVALSDSNMIDRAWLYTAITRSEDELHIIGSKERLKRAIRSLSAHHIRKTHLKQLLQE